MLGKRALLAVMMLALLFLYSCGDRQAQVGAEETPAAETPDIVVVEASPTPEPTETPPPDDNSGFVVPDPNVRPVAVMIDNQGDKVLPQGGISQAQIVYEILTEGGITRFMAIFWDTMPDMIGPVRSSRHYFLDFAMEYDAIYTHFGGSDYAKADIKKLGINNIDGLVHGNAFWDITNDPKNWQDSYTSRERVLKEAERLKYATTPKKEFPFKYHEQMTIPQNGQKAEEINIKFASSGSNCGYTYDQETQLYKRIRMGKPHMERNTGEQVSVRNIIILRMASPPIPNDKYGRINLNDIGTGEGWYITGGKAVKLTWSKKARDAQTVLTLESGEPLVLNRGQTWIEIVPNLNNVEIK
ncbi:MAG TPA: DUF3048 domain-containing protein [Thermoclostridium caenicola]|nr:DUF3048 domain-containing protein [Thermoclostridium caenicola]